MTLTDSDKQIVRDLARRVTEIAQDPVNDLKRDMWTRLNSLERVRPLVHIQAIAWNIWEELVPPDSLEAEDPFARQHELDMRKRIYCWEHFRDDRVVSGEVICSYVLRNDLVAEDFGIQRDKERSHERSGAYAIRPVIDSESDIDKIQTESEVSVDEEATERNYQRLSDLFGDTLPVVKRGSSFFWFYPMDRFIQWRGIEQMFVDLLERPEWIHGALERITQGHLNHIDRLERLGVLSPGNGNTMLGSGGYGWTDELPQPGSGNGRVRLKDLWARAATQIFTDGISPQMHDEFAIQYERRLLGRFGLSCYGCCEPLDRKMHVVRQIGNLRRVSMSPWVDIDRASEAVGRDYIYTHKPNPTIVSMTSWDPALARDQMRDMYEKTRDNVLEVNLQDLHTVQKEPRRLTEWTEMAIQLAEEYA
jgi:hypothetical protein